MKVTKFIVAQLCCMLLLLSNADSIRAQTAFIGGAAKESAVAEMVKKFGEKHRERIVKGVNQTASLWHEEDGSPADFQEFCLQYFTTEPEGALFSRYENNLDTVDGFFSEVNLRLHRYVHLELGPIMPVDMLFAQLNPAGHLSDDYFKTKLAFAALLNYPVTTLAEKDSAGKNWTRKQWAQTRLASGFNSRVPAKIQQESAKRYLEADHYISNYNIYMGNLLTEEGKRLFPADLKLISHWGLRDELKAQYSGAEAGVERQKMIYRVMERIIAQEIPQIVIDNPDVDWKPYSNKVYDKSGNEMKAAAEPSTRYGHLKAIFEAARIADPYFPQEPTLIRRHFNNGLEIAEKDVEKLLLSVVASQEVKDCGKLIEKRLGRPLSAYDIWYNGFENTGAPQEAELDKIVMAKYPDREAFQKDIPNILKKLGFSEEKAAYYGSKIVVDPARGAGHAWGAEGREFNAHLRTRFADGKMNYKTYNIAIHELGHCVEQVTSVSLIDHTLLKGVPNVAFTEAFAFLFQSRDLELLGLKNEDPMQADMLALDTLWSVYEIGGVSLVTMKTWRWMYEHPDADEVQLRQAVTEIAKDVWNRYYAPVFGEKDSTVLAVYSHMIDTDLYLPNYPIGHIIRYQVEDYIKDKNLAAEMERMCLQGNLTPNAWMTGAVGATVSTESLLKDASKAIEKLK